MENKIEVKGGCMPGECIDIPKILFEDETFSKLSVDARVLYALLLERMNSSAAMNGWTDEEGVRYVIYPKKEMIQNLNANRSRVDRALDELYKNGEMIVVKQSSPGKANRIYVKDITNLKQTKEPTGMSKPEELKNIKENAGEKNTEGEVSENNVEEDAERKQILEKFAAVEDGLLCMKCNEKDCPDRNSHMSGMFAAMFEELASRDWNLKEGVTFEGGNLIFVPAVSGDSDEGIRKKAGHMSEEEYYRDMAMDMKKVLGDAKDYLSFSPKQRRFIDMKGRGFLNARDKIDKNRISEYAGEDGMQLALFLLYMEQDMEKDLTDFYIWLDQLRSAGDYKTITIVISTLLYLVYGKNAEEHIYDMTCGNKKVKKIYMKMLLGHMEEICEAEMNTEE